MACSDCGHDARHDHRRCPTFTVAKGWCKCRNEVIGVPSVAPAVHDGRAVHRKLFDDTRKFRDKSVADAAAKARKRPTMGMSERRARLKG